MAHAVFIQNPDSLYDDRPGEAYHFPKSYLKRVQASVGDWVVFWEGKKGASAYVGCAKVSEISPDPDREGHYYAWLERGSYLEFPSPVPIRNLASDRLYEPRVPPTGGNRVSAVRHLQPLEFATIVRAGLETPRDIADIPLARTPAPYKDLPGLNEIPAPFTPSAATLPSVKELVERPDVLATRKWRDPAFRARVIAAYGFRCAISGLELRNGGGRPEVEAAHIKPVADKGPDIVQNGLALTGTLHWMFDRGLVGVAEDHRILISHNKVSPDVASRLIAPDQRLRLPDNPRHHPHPAYLRYHREHVFGQVA